MNVLFDHRKLRFDFATLDTMKETRDTFKKHEKEIGDGRIAILIDSKLGFARSRQFEMLIESMVSAKFKVFLDEDQALEWLLQN